MQRKTRYIIALSAVAILALLVLGNRLELASRNRESETQARVIKKREEVRVPQTNDTSRWHLEVRDIFDDPRFPTLKESGGLETNLQELQVLSRARTLGLKSTTASEAWRATKAAWTRASQKLREPDPSALPFSDTEASVLNGILKHPGNVAVRIVSRELHLDEPILIQRSDVFVDFGGAQLRSSPHMPFMIRIEGARNVVLARGVFLDGESAILVSGSSDVIVRDMRVSAVKGHGTVVTGSQNVVLWANEFTQIAGTPIIVHGRTTESVIAHNEVTDGKNSSNWGAGIVVTDRTIDLAKHPMAIYGNIEEPIVRRLQGPRNNLIAFNYLARNLSSAIYSDGAVGNVFASNQIVRNSKEGICLDNGSTANVVTRNGLQFNGERWGKSDADLRKEHVLQHGRLPDGTSVAKVPGVSIDNAAYNVVDSNVLHGNYGGGIKMVRTAVLNVIGRNTLIDNSAANRKFHFFAIELGAAIADEPVGDLDFAPSLGNLLYQNVVRGNHYAGIFLAEGSENNDLVQNYIFGSKEWAIESVRPQANLLFENYLNRPSRNVPTK